MGACEMRPRSHATLPGAETLEIFFFISQLNLPIRQSQGDCELYIKVLRGGILQLSELQMPSSWSGRGEREARQPNGPTAPLLPSPGCRPIS